MEIIHKLYEILELCKGFKAGYDGNDDEHMLIEYKGKRYAVKIAEIEHPSENIFDDIRNIRYLV